MNYYPVGEDEVGYEEKNYRVGKCPRGECKKEDSCLDMEKLLESAGEKDSTEGSKEVSLKNEKFERKESKHGKEIKFFFKPSEKVPEHGILMIAKICIKIIMKNEQKNVEEKVLKKLKSIESDCFQQENHKINEDTISEKKESKDIY